jgi:acyl carrier protein
MGAKFRELRPYSAPQKFNNMSNTYEKILVILEELFQLSKKDITLESTFDDIGLDSLDIVEMTMYVEDEFDIRVTEKQFEAFKTIGDVVALVDKMLSE